MQELALVTAVQSYQPTTARHGHIKQAWTEVSNSMNQEFHTNEFNPRKCDTHWKSLFATWKDHRTRNVPLMSGRGDQKHVEEFEEAMESVLAAEALQEAKKTNAKQRAEKEQEGVDAIRQAALKSITDTSIDQDPAENSTNESSTSTPKKPKRTTKVDIMSGALQASQDSHKADRELQKALLDVTKDELDFKKTKWEREYELQRQEMEYRREKAQLDSDLLNKQIEMQQKQQEFQNSILLKLLENNKK